MHVFHPGFSSSRYFQGLTYSLDASEVTLNPDEMWRTFRNLSLSYRGSERQAPNNLQLALRFSRALEIHQQQGTHPSSWGLEDRLKAVCKDFHENCGLTQKHRIDDDKFKSLVNLISGTTCATRAVIAEHLNHAKWKECAFSSEQFRSSRWTIGTAPKLQQCPMKKALTVTEESQRMHLQLVVSHFLESGRRLRPSARARMRLSQESFDRFSDFACVYAATLVEARQLTTFTPEKEAEIMKFFFQRCLPFDQFNVLPFHPLLLT